MSGTNPTIPAAAAAQPGPVLKAFKLDSGLEILVPADQVQLLEVQQRQHKDALTEKDRLLKDATEKGTAEVAKLNKDAGELRAEVDKLKADAAKEKTRADDAEKKLKEATSPAALSKVVRERAQLLAVASPVLGKAVKVDGKTIKLDGKIGEDVALDSLDDEQIRVAVLAKRIKGFQAKLDSVPEAQRSFYVATRFAEESEKIAARLKRRQDESMEVEIEGAEVEPVSEVSEIEPDPDEEDPEEEQERSDSREPRRVRADAVGGPGSRAPRKDAKDAYVEKVNNAGTLPEKRRIG